MIYNREERRDIGFRKPVDFFHILDRVEICGSIFFISLYPFFRYFWIISARGYNIISQKICKDVFTQVWYFPNLLSRVSCFTRMELYPHITNVICVSFCELKQMMWRLLCKVKWLHSSSYKMAINDALLRFIDDVTGII